MDFLKKCTILACVFVFIISCSQRRPTEQLKTLDINTLEHPEKEADKVKVDAEPADSSISSKAVKNTTYQESLDGMKLDKWIDKNIRVTVTPKFLDTYVRQEWESQDTINSITYIDISLQVKIVNVQSILLDTILVKENIIHPEDTSFLKQATFHGYWLNDYDPKKNTLTFNGNICKPDTDWCLFFNHIYNIETGALEFIILEQDSDY